MQYEQPSLSKQRTVFYSRPVAVTFDPSVSVASPMAAAYEPYDELPARSSMRLGSYLEVPFIYKKQIFTCLIASIGLGWLALLLWPRSYESETKLMVKVGRASIGVDPTVTTTQTLMLQKTQEEEINSAMQVLGSRSTIEAVVDRLGVENVLNGSLPSDGDGPVSWGKSTSQAIKKTIGNIGHFVMVSSGVRDTVSDRERAVRELQNHVSIYAPKKSTVISVDSASKSPQMAQAIGECITDIFLHKHMDVSGTKGSHDFFSSEALQTEVKLTSLINEKTHALKERHIVSIDAQRGLLTDRLTSIDRSIHASTASLEQANAEIEDLKQQIAATDDEIVATKMEQSDATWSGMRQRVYELELLEQSLASKYTDQHRTLIETRRQLEGAREILSKLQSDRVDHSMTPNPAKRRMQDALQQLETRVVGLRSNIQQQEKQRDSTQLEVNELARFELDLLQMDRDIELARNQLRMLQEKREEAKVLDQLQDNKISNISVFQPATLVERPAKPNKKVVALGFVMMGLFSGLGLAFLREASNTTLRSTEHVESSLRCPVVLTVSRTGALGRMGRFLRAGDGNPMRVNCQGILSEVLLSHGRPANSQRRGCTLGIIGVDVGCGASTLASALAMASSEECRLKTTLIDGDNQGRTISRSFGLHDAPGLTELVTGQVSAGECLQHLEHSRLSLIAYSSPGELPLAGTDPRDIMLAMDELTCENDLVIVDLPPASQPDHAVALAKHLDHVLVVVESERTEAAAAERLLRRLSDGNVHIVGVVLNKRMQYMPPLLSRFAPA